MKIVEWSDEVAVSAGLYAIVEEWIAVALKDGKPLPPATARPPFATGGMVGG